MKRGIIFMVILFTVSFFSYGETGEGVNVSRDTRGLTMENSLIKVVLTQKSNFQVNEIYLKGEEFNFLRPDKYGAIGISLGDEEPWLQAWRLATINNLEYKEVKGAKVGKVIVSWSNPLVKAEDIITLYEGVPIVFVETKASFCKVAKILGFNYPYIEMSQKEDFIYPTSSGIVRVKKEKWDKPKRKWVRGEKWQGKWAGLQVPSTHRGIILFIEEKDGNVSLFGGLSLGLHWRNYIGRIVDEKTEPFHAFIGLMPFKGDVKLAVEEGLKFWDEYKEGEE